MKLPKCIAMGDLKKYQGIWVNTARVLAIAGLLWMLHSSTVLAVGVDYTWVGGTSSSWSEPTNWSPNGIPGTDALDTVTFDTNQVDCNIDRNISVAGITLTSNYTHTLTQTSTYTITIGANGYSQAGGTFQGGSGAITSSTFTLSGGTFNSTSGTFTINASSGTIWNSSASGTFNHRNGTVSINGGNTSTSVAADVIFNNLTIALSDSGKSLSMTSSDIFIVTGIFTFNTGHINNGTIESRGDVLLGANSGSGSFTLSFLTAGNQSISGISGANLGKIYINKPSGEVSIAGGIDFHTRGITLESGTFISTSGTLYVEYSASGYWTHTGGTFNHNYGTVSSICLSFTLDLTETFYNFTAASGNTTFIPAGKTLIVQNNFTNSGSISSGIVQAQGNVVIGASAAGGTALLQFTGSNNQTYTDSGGTKTTGAVTVNKTGGALNLASNLNYSAAGQTFTLENGTINQGSYIMTFRNYTQTGGIFNGGSGNITLSGVYTLNGGTFNSTSGVISNSTAASGLVWATEGGIFNHNNGTVSIYVSSYGTETVNVNNNEKYYNLILGTQDTNRRLDISGDTIVVDGTFTQKKGQINNGILKINGNVLLENNGTSTYGGQGTVVLQFTNGTDQTIDCSGGNTTCSLPSITINKPTGTINVLAPNLSVRSGALTLNSGTFNSTSGKLYLYSTNWTHNGGVFKHNNGTVEMYVSGGTYNISSPGSETFYNLTLTGQDYNRCVNLSGQLVNVMNTFKHGDTDVGVTVQNGTVNVYGDVFTGYVDLGSLSSNYLLNFVGSNNQTHTYLTSRVTTNTITVNKTGGILSLASAVTYNAAGQAFNLTSGTLDMNGNNLSVTNLTVGAAGVLKNTGATGTLTVGGPVVNNGNVQMRTSGGCGGADTVAIQSSVAGTQRAWSGTGTTNFSDITVQDQGGTQAITAYSSTSTSGNGANWTFSGACPVLLVTPNSGESYAPGATVSIQYTAYTGADHYRVLLSTNSGVTYPNMLGTSATTSYSWTVPPGSRSGLRIKVQAEDAGNAVLSTASSSRDFTIVAPNSYMIEGGVNINGGLTL